MTAYERHVCDRCDYEAGGYNQKELEKDGWVWHKAGVVKGRPTEYFVMCWECEVEVAENRAKAVA